MTRLNMLIVLPLAAAITGCSDPYREFNYLKPDGWGIGDDVAALQATRTPKVLEEDEQEDFEPGATIYEYPEKAPTLGDFEITMTKAYGSKDTMRITSLHFSLDYAGDLASPKKKRRAIRKCYKSIRKQISKATGVEPVEGNVGEMESPGSLKAVWTDTRATPAVVYTLSEDFWGLKYSIELAQPAACLSE